jgi:uncharacterized protein YjbI with pentapeptide repeats
MSVVTRRRRVAAATALSLFLASVILAGVDAWDPVTRYFGDYRDHWRTWIAIVACVLAVTGAVVAWRRPGVPGRPRAARSRMAAQPSAPQSRGWIAAAATTVPGLVAVVGLVFTALTVRANEGQLATTQQQLTITELGQITDRYNAAVANLGNDNSIDIRLGGIYALQHVMQDDPLYQPTVAAVLSAFARDESTSGSRPEATSTLPDVQAALNVVGDRDVRHDGSTTVVDLDHALLPGAQLKSALLSAANIAGATLASADLYQADLVGADLDHANLAGANLDVVDFTGANLTGTNLAGALTTDAILANANLSHANLTGTVLADVKLTGASFAAATLTGAVLAGENATGVYFGDANLTNADLSGAVLKNAYLVAAEINGGKFANAILTGADFTGADLTSADIRSANLTGVNLSYANLSRVTGDAADLARANLTGADLSRACIRGYGANLTDADLTDADLTDANLTDANLAGATLNAAKFAGANLTGTRWPHGLAPPPGWQRNPASDRLQPTRPLSEGQRGDCTD